MSVKEIFETMEYGPAAESASEALAWLATQETKPVILAELLAEFFHPNWDEQAAALEGLTRVGYDECDLSQMEKIDDILLFPSGYVQPES